MDKIEIYNEYAGIYFSIPNYWMVSEIPQVNDNGEYVNLDFKAQTEDGRLIMMGILYEIDDQNLSDEVDLYINNLQESGAIVTGKTKIEIGEAPLKIPVENIFYEVKTKTKRINACSALFIINAQLIKYTTIISEYVDITNIKELLSTNSVMELIESTMSIRLDNDSIMATLEALEKIYGDK